VHSCAKRCAGCVEECFYRRLCWRGGLAGRQVVDTNVRFRVKLWLAGIKISGVHAQCAAVSNIIIRVKVRPTLVEEIDVEWPRQTSQVSHNDVLVVLLVVVGES